MNVQEGDKAVIVFSVRPENVGRIVNVAEYIGKFKEGEQFEFRTMPCQALVHDHYWWIEAEDLSIMFGPSPRAYIADSWLRKIVPLKEKSKQKEELELEIFEK
jgi:ATP-dependent protease Clp ATPase subunit